MASDREYLDYILDCLSLAEDISFRPMMGEFIIYKSGKVIGGIYDNRFLIKPVASAKRLIPNAVSELPYEGAKEMLLVSETDNRELMRELVNAVFNGLPERKK